MVLDGGHSMTDLLDDRLGGCKTPTVTVDVSVQSQMSWMRSADQCAGGPTWLVLQDERTSGSLFCQRVSTQVSYYTKYEGGYFSRSAHLIGIKVGVVFVMYKSTS